MSSMSEIFFVVAEAAEGGYTAQALGASIMTEADTLGELYAAVRDAVKCHFEDDQAPQTIAFTFTHSRSP
jgi:hypothetical protein